MANDQKAYQQRLERYASNTEAEINSAFSELLGTHKGRSLVWWLLQIGRVNSQPFASSPDKTAFQCGELNVGLQVMARIIEASPDGYLATMKEKQSERDSLSTDPSPDADSADPGADPNAGRYDAPGDNSGD